MGKIVKFIIAVIPFLNLGYSNSIRQQQTMMSSFVYEHAYIEGTQGQLNKTQALQQFERDVKKGASQNSKIPKKNRSIFRIMTYNVHFWKSPDTKQNALYKMLSVIRKINPDLVILQEVTPNPGFGIGAFKQSESKQLLYNSRFNYFVDCNTLQLPHWFGNVIASKVPLNNLKSFKFNHQYGGQEQRCFVAAQINIVLHKELYIYDTHLEVDGPDDLRKAQIEEISSYITTKLRDKNVLIAADFNATRDSQVVKALERQGFKDCFSYMGWQHPWYTNWTGKEIDFIFLSPDWHLPLAGCYVYYDAASDHLPVIMDIKI